MKKAALVFGLLFAFAAPLLAQATGPFADVPTDHWAYEAVNQLQQDGILIGYPDGTFGGKRAMTRYEFAVAIARMIPIVTKQIQPGQTIDTSQFATKADIANMATKADLANLPTKADVDALRKLVDEFRDELAALGVDVDALKRDVAALNDRVTALEKEVARAKWYGEVDAIGTANRVTRGGTAFDRDDRALTSTKMLRDVTALENVDLRLVGKLTDYASANVDVIGGNYLSWIGRTVDNYTVFDRPGTGLADTAALYYANVDWAFGAGNAVFGRLPIQWTPYTLKMIDVDSYTNIAYTDSGNYPIDGAKVDFRLGGVKLNAFASKNNQNSLLSNGLTGQPNSGLYRDFRVFNDVGGQGACGLNTIDQSAGVRVMLGTPFKGNLGLSYLQVASSDTPFGDGGAYNRGDVWGADLNFNLASFLVGLNWTRTDARGTGVAKIDTRNTAADGKIGFTIGGLGIDAGYKRIDRNFAAPGYWDKIGRWTNPTNIKGPYAKLTYGITPNVNLIARAADYKGSRDEVLNPNVDPDIDQPGDKILHAEAGLKWGLSTTNSVDLGVEWVRWRPAGEDKTQERYYNIGWGYQINPSAGFKLQYQIVDYKPAALGLAPYGNTAYKGNIANAQFGVKF